jgi:hypothetical protein
MFSPKKRTTFLFIGLLLILSLACSVSGNGGNTPEEPPPPEPAPTDTPAPEPPTDTPAPEPPTDTPAPEPTFADAVGDWEGTDIDGSYQTMTITQNADGAFSIDYHDDGASVCGLGNDGSPLYPADGGGSGSAAGLALTISLNITCHGDTDWTEGPFSVTYTYDASTDTIADSVGSTWTRTP